MAKSGSRASKPSISGKAIHECLQAILKRCEDAGVHLGYPGEGRERPFRGWLVSDFLVGLLGWPPEKVVVGERFDLLIQDADGFPVITIETKTPYHKASRKEREDFESRLSGYGTLRTAYFTNGNEWERLDIFAPTGAFDIRDRFALDIDKATDEELEAFFAPLPAARYLSMAVRSTRHAVTRHNPHILENLAADFDQVVGDMAFFLRPLFDGLRQGRSGAPVRHTTLDLFDLWCHKSLTIDRHKAAEHVAKTFEKESLTPAQTARVLKELGLDTPKTALVAEELLAMPNGERQDPDKVVESLWPVYDETIDKLCAQTAHVLLGRVVLYRVGEDQGVFPRVLSGETMEKALSRRTSAIVTAPLPAIELVSQVRQSMADFLAVLYSLSEFDWWVINQDKRAVLGATEKEWLNQTDLEFERIIERLLRMLNGYFFGKVDVDVWRNVYQHYLPSEERQRLGGFYTPDELVNLVLDLSEYKSDSEGLCQLSFIDPACGSGAFVTGALGRLLEHLHCRLPCHQELHTRGKPSWKQAEEILAIVSDRLHAVDIHPFAAFLTTLNVLFLLLPLYVKAREKNPMFSLGLQIFSADSLEKPDIQQSQLSMFSDLNARVQLTKESLEHYRGMLDKHFDRVFGNPPWGGVLKGPLAPVYDMAKKQRFAGEFPAAAKGKYDVYGLFMERALQVLKPGGRFGLLTQDTFLDKEWAKDLRKLLAGKTTLKYIVDLNPFGQLFFKAMNTPCVTVSDSCPSGDDEVVAVISDTPNDFRGLNEQDRRARVISVLQSVVQQVMSKHEKASVGFATGLLVPCKQLREAAGDRWDLSGSAATVSLPGGWRTAADVLESSQGVTVGGTGCQDLMLVTKEEAGRLELEAELIHPIVKGIETERWSLPKLGMVLIYPYIVSNLGSKPAFAISLSTVKDTDLQAHLRQQGIIDALDFDHLIDEREREIIRATGKSSEPFANLLRHRVALGIVTYRKVAQYLTEHYRLLEGRVFEQKGMTATGKRWYEFHRPRDANLMLASPKIISPRLTRTVRFGLDTVGVIPQDSCICLVPGIGRLVPWRLLCKHLGQAIGCTPSDDATLKYCLAFLNSSHAQQRLTAGRRPTPKGSYAITDAYLREIPVPPPSGENAHLIVGLVDKLVASTNRDEISKLERRLAVIVDPMLATG